MTEPMSEALRARPYRGVLDNATAGLGWARGAHIAISGNLFQLVNDAGQPVGGPTQAIEVVIVDANQNTSKRYYKTGMDANSKSPPTCFSDNGTGPSEQALEPQAPTCMVCPHNAVGSAVSYRGNKTKACQDRKKLAVIIPGDTAVNVYTLDLPPNSLTNMRKYFEFLRIQPSGDPSRKMDAADVITRMIFADPKQLGRITFQPVGYADDPHTMSLVEHIFNNQLSDSAVGRDDVAYDPEVVKRLKGEEVNQLSGIAKPQVEAPVEKPEFVMPPRQPQTGPSPGLYALQSPQWPTHIPERPAPVDMAALGQAIQPPPAAPRRPGRPKKGEDKPSAAAPFMAAAQQSAPAPAISVPPFVQHEMAVPPTGIPPAPPDDIQAQIAAAMQMKFS